MVGISVLLLSCFSLFVISEILVSMVVLFWFVLARQRKFNISEILVSMVAVYDIGGDPEVVGNFRNTS